MERIVAPGGQEIEYTYDSRSNITEMRRVAASGSGLADLVQSATYPTSCSNPVTCNQPTSTTDTAGNTTDYTYDATHGGLRTVTAPAVGGDRPRTEIFYGTRRAYYKLTSGGSITAGDQIYLPTRVSSCRTGGAGSCYTTTTERRMTLYYGLQNGTANNLHQRNETVRLGDGTLAQTTTYAHDEFGNVTVVDGPVSGNVDSVHMRYDLLRRQVGMIGPDPDGTGPRLRAAQRMTYDGDGRVTEQEAGTVNGISDTAWAAFSRTQRQAVDYDVIGRVLEARSYAAGTTIDAVIQRTYGTDGRLACAAMRMNPAVYSSLPSSACSLGTTGSSGPDRITEWTYDDNGRVLTVTEAAGTADEAEVRRMVYTANGQVERLFDGNGNRVYHHIYDGHDRLKETNFADPTSTGNSNWSDDVQYTYDSAGRIATRRVRTNELFSYSYDALGRVTDVTAPSGTASSTFTYDHFGNVLTVSDGTNTVTNTFNAMGQLLSQAQMHGTVSYEYDSVGRRTRMTWPDSYYVEYDWNDISQLTAIRENGATFGVGVLAQFEYDDFGRRTALTRGNGTETRYDFDAMGRLGELVTDLAGTANDNTDSFTFNPAGQIASRTRTNADYSYASHINIDSLFGHNGLNQITSKTGAPAPTYDGRGKMTSDGAFTYTYDTYNRLTSADDGTDTATLSYDPMGRLEEYDGLTGVAVNSVYDGADMIAWKISGTITRRFIHGPGTNEPLVQVDASTGDRTFLHGNHQGSIIAHTDDTGAQTATFGYDEYGNSGGAGPSSYGYTGQLWLGDIGLYHMHNRVYSPTHMRFMQTDPIGVSGGINLYAYVGGDPVNFTDAWGLEREVPEGYRRTNEGCHPGEHARPLGDNWFVCEAFAVFGAPINYFGDVDPFADTGALSLDGGEANYSIFPKNWWRDFWRMVRGQHDRARDRVADEMQSNDPNCRVTPEVSFRDPYTGTVARADLVVTYTNPDTGIDIKTIVLEVKTGSGTWNHNQRVVYPRIVTLEAIPIGPLAAAAGYTPGVPLSEQGVSTAELATVYCATGR